MAGISKPLVPSTNRNERGDKMRQKKLIFFMMLFATVLSFAVAPSTSSAASVLATAEGEKPGVSVEVTELKRTSGGTVNLKFVMINDSEKNVDLYKEDFGSYGTVSGVALVDEKNKKKYFVVLDSGHKCLCSSGLKNLPPKSRVNLWAKFPAPAEDVQKIVVVIPHFQPMDDVPISR
jgi:hypothetical protein